MEELLARNEGARHVEQNRRPGVERFASLQRRVRNGLGWGLAAR